MSSDAQFDQFRWMGGWLRAGLDTTTIAVLAALLDHMGRDGRAWPSLETIAKMVNKSPRTIRRSLRVAEELGWIKTDDRGLHSNMYTALTGHGRHDERTPVSINRTPMSGGADMGDTLTGHGCHDERTPVSARTDQEQTKNKPMDISAKPRELKSEITMDEQTTEIHALLKIEGHPVSNETAIALKTHIEKHQPNALAYLEARLIADSMGDRFKRTRSLLRALEQDAVNDGAAVYQNHPDDPSHSSMSVDQISLERDIDRHMHRCIMTPILPGPPVETYEHPRIWEEALAILAETNSTKTVAQWFEPIRAEYHADGDQVVLWFRTEFDAAWVSDQYGEPIKSACDCSRVRYEPSEEVGDE